MVDPDPNFYGGTFERYVKVTKPDNSQELYAMMSLYTDTDWPNWASGQIPDTSAAAVHTLDTTDRQGRNTFYWNAQQRAVMTKEPTVDAFAWTDFKKGRIRHWLTTTINGYAHWGTLSWEQQGDQLVIHGVQSGGLPPFAYEPILVPASYGHYVETFAGVFPTLTAFLTSVGVDLSGGSVQVQVAP